MGILLYMDTRCTFVKQILFVVGYKANTTRDLLRSHFGSIEIWEYDKH